jgi:hypothetical protein
MAMGKRQPKQGKRFIPTDAIPEAAGHPFHRQLYVPGNRQWTRGARCKHLQRQRSEKLEWPFAHVCETGGRRRNWLREVEDVSKRHLMQAAAHHLGIVMRKRSQVGTPRSLQGTGKAFSVFRALRNAQKHAIALLRWAPCHARTVA